ncbi:GNAT family N-acetyltransferase [Streptomyces sp. H34-S4]|uniref:GNAT family N-acetyltransferase n=1 Tax=Streptomyces sp. H34-S4 TaxID=2996463 RepID=UPI002270FB80|nr:GNAT family N-acetyltransferase [Streptomyces sp. H34-S4]MCY0933812.1 GNAT family N-acetyltransferase [Streptomyces sp. H34-S4]
MHQLLNSAGAAHVRTATLADLPLIETFHRSCSEQALHRRWGRTRITRRDIERLLHYSACWIALHTTDEVVALASAGPVSREPGVFDLGLQVADVHQRRGIGLALARHAAAHGRSRGAHTFSVYTEASNLPMLGLVRRLGHPTESRQQGTHLDVRVPLPATPSATHF